MAPPPPKGLIQVVVLPHPGTLKTGQWAQSARRAARPALAVPRAARCAGPRSAALRGASGIRVVSPAPLCSGPPACAHARGLRTGPLLCPPLPRLPPGESPLDSSAVVMGSPEGRFHFAIDRGGTFTDVFAQCPGGHVRVLKLLSEDPANYADAPTEGIRRILEQVARASSGWEDPRPQGTMLTAWLVGERCGAASGPAAGHQLHCQHPHGHHSGHQCAAGAARGAGGAAGDTWLPGPAACGHPGP